MYRPQRLVRKTDREQATQDVEMGKVRTGPVQIQTQIETVQHVDVRCSSS